MGEEHVVGLGEGLPESVQLPLQGKEVGKLKEPMPRPIRHEYREEWMQALVSRDHGAPAQGHHVEEIGLGAVDPPPLSQSR